MISVSGLRLFSLFAFVLCGAAVSQVSILEAAEPLRVRLRFRAEFEGQTVRVGDVAEVTGGTPAQRHRLANLDLERLTQRSQFVEITRRRVHLRCLLSGISRTDLSVSGPSRCLVRATYISVPRLPEEPVKVKSVDPDEIAIDEIRSVLAKRWNVPQSEVTVHLTQPIPGLLKFAGGTDPLSIRAYPPANPQQGTLKLKIIARLASGRALTSMAEVAVRLGKAKPLAGLPGNGQKTTARNHTSPVRPKELGPIVVRPRDTVRLVATKGTLKVALAQAEVLKSARIGEMVELKNPKSRKKISARLVSASQAVIELNNPQRP